MFTGISYGQQLTRDEYRKYDDARESFKHANRMLCDPLCVMPKGSKQLMESQRDAALDIMCLYRNQPSGMPNNVAVLYSRAIYDERNNISHVTHCRHVLAWIPKILQKEAMLPTLYNLVAQHCKQGEFVQEIDFL